jgi:hypothetical protein
MDFNKLSRKETMDGFHSWYLKKYKRNPECLYTNMLILSDWNIFQKEREMELIDELYVIKEYKSFVPLEDFMDTARVICEYLTSLS